MTEQSGLIPIGQAARLLMISEERIRQLVKQGYVPKSERRGYVQLVGAVQGYLKYLKEDERRSTRSAADSRVRDARALEIELRIDPKNAPHLAGPHSGIDQCSIPNWLSRKPRESGAFSCWVWLIGVAPLTLRHPTHDRGSAEKVYFMTCFGAVVVGYTLFRGPDERGDFQARFELRQVPQGWVAVPTAAAGA